MNIVKAIVRRVFIISFTILLTFLIFGLAIDFFNAITITKKALHIP